MKDRTEFDRLIGEANAAKDRLYEISQGLEAAGYKRKAKACLNLVYKIEEWQTRGA